MHVCVCLCVKGHSWSMDNPRAGGAEVRWLRQLEKNHHLMLWEKGRGPTGPSADRPEQRKRPGKAQGRASCNQIPLGMHGEAIVKPWKNR